MRANEGNSECYRKTVQPTRHRQTGSHHNNNHFIQVSNTFNSVPLLNNNVSPVVPPTCGINQWCPYLWYQPVVPPTCGINQWCHLHVVSTSCATYLWYQPVVPPTCGINQWCHRPVVPTSGATCQWYQPVVPTTCGIKQWCHLPVISSSGATYQWYQAVVPPTCRINQWCHLPVVSTTTPPASQTIKAPAAISQQWMPKLCVYASTIPEATLHMSRAVDPGTRRLKSQLYMR